MPTIHRLTIALAGVALFASACGGGDEAEAAVGVATLEDVETDVAEVVETDTELEADEAALEFSACMRDQGLDFPDIGVDAEGNPDLRDAFLSSGITPGSDEFRTGMDACGEILQSAGFGGGGGRAALTDNPEITDVNSYEWVAWAPLLALILFFGLYPRPLFTTTDDAVVNSLHPCLEEEGDAGEDCFDDLRDAAEAAGG